MVIMFSAVTTQTEKLHTLMLPLSLETDWYKTVAPYCWPCQIMCSSYLYIWILCSNHEYFPTFSHLFCLQLFNIYQNCHDTSPLDLYKGLKF